MKNHILLVALFAVCLANATTANAASSDEIAIRKLLDDWRKAFHEKNLDAIMTMYAPGKELVAFDIVPPLRYVGYDAYRKDYSEFLAQYKGPIDVEYKDMVVVSSGDVAFSYGLERMSGVLTSGQKTSMWTRFTSCFRKVNGRWYDVHDHVSVPSDLEKGTAMIRLAP